MNGSFAKQLYHVIVFLGSVTLFAVLGLAGYCWITGRLNAERIDHIAMVLRGEVCASQPAISVPAEPKPSGKSAYYASADVRAVKEYYLLCLERNKRELAASQALNQSIRKRVDVLIQELKDQKQQFERERQAFYSERKRAGFDKTLEMLSSIDPLKARDILIQKDKFDREDVVRLLMAMDKRKATRIINTCRSPEEVTWIGNILSRIHNLHNESAAGLLDGPLGSAGKG